METVNQAGVTTHALARRVRVLAGLALAGDFATGLGLAFDDDLAGEADFTLLCFADADLCRPNPLDLPAGVPVRSDPANF